MTFLVILLTFQIRINLSNLPLCKQDKARDISQVSETNIIYRWERERMYTTGNRK